MASLAGDSAVQGQGDIGTFQQIHKSGYAMLITNINPKGNNGTFEFKTREGANGDSSNLQMVFLDKLGCKWINPDCHEDVTTLQWDHRKSNATINEGECKCLRCRIEKTDHSQSKCFVLAISSHGREITETEIIFSDGNSIRLTEIFEALNDINCPSLVGKPRIIILQVCRAIFKDPKKVLEMQDKGVNVLTYTDTSEQCLPSGQNLDPGQGSSSDSDGPTRFIRESVEDHTLQQLALAKMPKNYLLLYPVVSGQKSRRNANDGSWLLHGMKKIILEKYSTNTKPVNFLQFITKVSGYVAREKESVKYKKKNDNTSDEAHQSENQLSENEISVTTAHNEREKKTKSEWVKDEEQSGFKNAVCLYHRLTSPITFYPKEITPELPKSKPVFG